MIRQHANCELSVQNGNDSFEFTVTAKLRHGALWSLVKKFGSQSALAKHLGIRATDIGKLINLRKPPVNAKWWSRVADELLLLTGQSAEELFPEWLQTDLLDGARTAEQTRRLNLSEVRNLSGSVEEPVAIAERHEASEAIHQALKRLSIRERNVVRLRWGIDTDSPLALEECAKVFGVTRERVRQIEAKALRKLQYDRQLQQVVDEPVSPSNDSTPQR